MLVYIKHCRVFKTSQQLLKFCWLLGYMLPVTLAILAIWNHLMKNKLTFHSRLVLFQLLTPTLKHFETACTKGRLSGVHAIMMTLTMKLREFVLYKTKTLIKNSFSFLNKSQILSEGFNYNFFGYYSMR